MNLHLSTNYPLLFLMLCLLGGLAYASILYIKNDFGTGKPFYSWPNLLMMILRIISVSLIAFFLLNPFIQRRFRHIQKPLIVIGLDNSASMTIGNDSEFVRKILPEKLDKLTRKLDNKYEVKTLLFDSETKGDESPEFNGQNTNISSFINEVDNLYKGQNLGAALLFSDGNYNLGSQPLQPVLELGIPVYPVLFGDTTHYPDLIIDEVEANAIAYKGNVFTVKVTTLSNRMNGSSATLKVTKNGKTAGTKQLHFSSDQDEKITEFQLEAGEIGLQKYTVTVSGNIQEDNLVNNTKNFYIEVLENRKKLLFLAAAPHPDLNALKNAFETNSDYQVESYLAIDFLKKKDLVENLKKFDAVFLHQLPSRQYPVTSLLAALENYRIPQCFIIGEKTSLDHLSASQDGFQVMEKSSSTNESTASLNDNFAYFTTGDKVESLTRILPPLYCPFGDYNISLPHQILMFQKIGKLVTDMPLWVFVEGLQVRKTYICGEGIWRWPLTEFKVNGNSEQFKKLLYQTVQYLSATGNKRRFFLKDFKKEFFENEEIVFKTELYNESFEFFPDASIKLIITDENRKNYNFEFSESEGFYKANAGSLAAGNYHFTALTKINGKDLNLSGEFIVKENNAEYQQTTANYKLMNQIASTSGGRMFFSNNFQALPDTLAGRDDLKPISFQETENKSLINLKSLFFVILILLSAEWFFRKYFGRY